MPITYLIPRKFSYVRPSCPGDFEQVVLCAPKSAANSRVGLLCAPKIAANSRIVVPCTPKSAANSKILETGTSLGKKTRDPLHSHYIEKS